MFFPHDVMRGTESKDTGIAIVTFRFAWKRPSQLLTRRFSPDDPTPLMRARHATLSRKRQRN